MSDSPVVEIKFGTDGWRAIIAREFTFANVERVAQAYADYYGAVADYNRAQFRLYRALGRPAQLPPVPEPEDGPELPSCPDCGPVLPVPPAQP